MGEPDSASETWLYGRKGITVIKTQNGLSLDAPNLHDGSACFLLNQRIVARGRIVLLEMMEKVSTIASDVEICYANIDSIHFSVPTAELASALEALRPEISGGMGSFKIEAVTRHGLWLEPGRYWLYSDTVEKFRNRSIGNRLSPFKDHDTHIASQKIGDLYVPIKIRTRMEKTMSGTRAIVFDAPASIARYTLIEIGETTSFAGVLDQLEVNRKRWTPKRMEAFQDLQSRLSDLVPLLRDEA